MRKLGTSSLPLPGEDLPPADPRSPEGVLDCQGLILRSLSPLPLPGVEPCVGQLSGSLLCAGEVYDTHHEDEHQGDHQQEETGNPGGNQRDQVANQHQGCSSQEHQGNN